MRLRGVERGGLAPREAVRVGQAVPLDEDTGLTEVAEVPRLLAGAAGGLALGASGPQAVFDPDHRLVERGHRERPAVLGSALVTDAGDPQASEPVAPVDDHAGSPPSSPVSRTGSASAVSTSPSSPTATAGTGWRAAAGQAAHA